MYRLIALIGLLLATSGLSISSEIQVDSLGFKLYGTLQSPQKTTHGPIALILGDRGNIDRDGNSTVDIKVGSYKKLADVLQKAGISTLRFDKRGVGRSRGINYDESQLNFGSYVADALAWLLWIRESRSYGPVYLIGHGEGALVAMSLLSNQKLDIKKLFLVAAPGETLGANLRRQVAMNAANPPVLVEKVEYILGELENSRLVQNIDPVLNPLFHQSIQPLLISELKIDPLALIKSVKIPTVIFQGSRDIQVEVKEAQALLRSQPNANLIIIPTMNHVLVDASLDINSNVSTYSMPQIPLSREFTTELINLMH